MAAILQGIGNLIVAVLTGLAASNSYPDWTPVFTAVSGVIFGWLNLSKPKDPAAAAPAPLPNGVAGANDQHGV